MINNATGESAMMDDAIKHDYIRAKTEQRMMPMVRLRRRQFWLLTFAGMFIFLTFFTNALRGNEIYNVVMPFFWICFALGMIQTIRFIFDFQHEVALQNEMKREMELERLRLLHDLAFTKQGVQVSEKLKNTLSLSDDGELIANDKLSRSQIGINHQE